MANPLLIAKAAQSFGTPITNFLLAGEQSKLQAEQQRHRNTVTAISSNLQRNAVTLQEIDVRAANRRGSEAIQLRALEDQAGAEVSAAAAGVGGGSVKSVMRGLKRSELKAQFARLENTQNAYQSLGQQRTNINVSQVFNTDASVIPKPSVAALLLGMGTAAVDTYENFKSDDKR